MPHRRLDLAGKGPLKIVVNSDGLSGGIGLYLSIDVEVELKNYSTGHIDILVRVKDQSSLEWRFTGLYGALRVEDRHHSWCVLRTLHAQPHSLWMCMGNFNDSSLARNTSAGRLDRNGK